MAINTNRLELFINANKPNPQVVIPIIINPSIIEFLEPILFFINELKGANIIDAIEKTDIIAETCIDPISEHSIFAGSSGFFLSGFGHSFMTPSQSCFSSVYKGKKVATFKIIMFPMNKANRQDIIIPFFSVGVYSSSLDYFFF
jgi:hypothetical protein